MKIKINCYMCGKFRVCKVKTIYPCSFLFGGGSPKVVNICKGCSK